MLAILQSALLIFSLRLVDMSLYSIRIMMVVRGRKVLAWCFAICQSLVFVSALRIVFSDLGNWGKILGYTSGYATGMILGMWLEERLAIGYTHFRIISPGRGAEISERLREDGYAVTEVPATGMEGAVTLLNCYVFRRDTRQLQTQVTEIDSDAFVTAEEVRPLHSGYWHRRGR
jgi:uncharacterized protein YebE (UPF0316 family)